MLYKKSLPFLLKNLAEKSASIPTIEISYITNNSRDVTQNTLFLAYPGEKADGRKYIAEAIAKVGKNGVITVEEGRSMEMEVLYKDGMEFDKGYVSAYFVTNTDKMESEIDEPYILITDKKISSLNEFLPFLESFQRTRYLLG